MYGPREHGQNHRAAVRAIDKGNGVYQAWCLCDWYGSKTDRMHAEFDADAHRDDVKKGRV